MLGNEYVMFEEIFLFYGDDSNNDKKYLFIVGVLYEFFSRILGVEYVNDLYEVLSFWLGENLFERLKFVSLVIFKFLKNIIFLSFKFRCIMCSLW